MSWGGSPLRKMFPDTVRQLERIGHGKPLDRPVHGTPAPIRNLGGGITEHPGPDGKVVLRFQASE